MAASRQEDDDCVDDLRKYESVAILLALALQEEDAEKFLDVYDHVIPENLPRKEVDFIKDRSRELASLPQDALNSLKKQYNSNKVESNSSSTTQSHSLSKSVHLSTVTETSPQQGILKNSVSEKPTSVPLLAKCPVVAMEEDTPLTGAAATCKNEDSPGKAAVVSKTKNIWNNNNNILTGLEASVSGHCVTRSNSKSYDILNGNDAAVVDLSECYDNHHILSNTNLSVPVGRFAQTYKGEFTECTTGINNNPEKPVAPYSQQELIQSAVELIDSTRLVRSRTFPEPVFVDPNKPADQALQTAAGALDMAATGTTQGTKKTVLANVRLAPASKNTLPSLPNGTINNKNQVAVTPGTLNKVKGVPNDETPLMGNSQRTDSSSSSSSSVCVKQSGYGTHVPSTRNDHLLSSCNNVPDSNHAERPHRGKHASLSPSGEGGRGDTGSSSKPATLGEQFEASKAQEGKKKKSKKKKKKVPDQEKSTPSPVAAGNNDNVEETFELALQDLPPPTPKNTLVSSDSVTSNEEFSSDTGGVAAATPVNVKPTIASKMLDGSFHIDQEQKSLSRSSLDSPTSATKSGIRESKGGESTVIATNCKVQDGSDQIKTDDKLGDNVTTHSKINNKTKPAETNPQYKTDFKTVLKTGGDNDQILANDKQMEPDMLLNTTSHPSTQVLHGETVDMEDYQYHEETSPGDDDGEFQEVMSSRRSRRARKIKGVSMEDRSYTYKPIDKDGVRRGSGNNTSGMRKSSSEPASMARLGEMESEQEYGRKLPINNRNNVTITANTATSDKPALIPPPKPNTESTPQPTVPATISYAGKVKAGIVHPVVPQNTPKSMIPVKFTLEDEHSDGHVSDSSIKSPQNEGTTPSPPNQSQRTILTNLQPPIVQTKVEERDANKIMEDGKPKQDVTVRHQQRAGGTSPKFEISFGEFTSVYISGAPKSLKTSCDIATSEGLLLSNTSRPLQKTRSNSVDGLETTEGATTDSVNTTSTTLQHHQEANVQYLDLHQRQSANTYASRLKRSLPPTSNSPLQGLTQPPPPPVASEDVVQVTVRQNEHVAMETGSVPEPPVHPVDKQHLAPSDNTVQHLEINQTNPQGASPPLLQSGSSPHTVAKPQNSSVPRVENKNRQPAVKAAHVSGVVKMAKASSPTPSVTSSRGASSVCFPLNMEPIDLGITFGDVNISEVLNVASRRDSPVDKLMTSSVADNSSLPQVPSTGHSCTDLEMAWRDENKAATIESPAVQDGGGDGMKGGVVVVKPGQDVVVKMMSTAGRVAVEMENTNIGNFNYYEVAGMLMKAWASTVEQKEANPSRVLYFTAADPRN